MKLLVIDDKPDNLVSVTAMLRTFLPGCETATAGSGPAGIAQARTFQPDTILLDVQMPGMDGFQACQALKADSATRHIPIIFLTAQKTDPASRIRGLEIGGDAFLTKPVDPGELMAQVRAMVRIKLAEDALRGEKESLERQVAERTAALRANEQLHSSIIQTAMAGFWLGDTQGRLLEVNETYCRMSGYSAQELLALRIPDLVATETPAQTAAHIQEIIAQGEDRFESRHRRKDGTEYDVDVTVQYRPTSGGQFVAFLRDITGRKRAEDALRQSEASFRSLAENAFEGIVIIAVDGRQIYANGRAAEILGCTTEQLVGTTLQDWVVPEECPLAHQRVADRLAGAQVPAQNEMHVRRKDGTVLLIEALASRLNWHGQNCDLVFFRDITERRKADAARALMEAQLQQSRKLEAIGQLAGGVAHDFNNKLQVIMGCAELIAKGMPESHPLWVDLEDIRQAAKQSADMTRQLLAFSRRQAIAPKALDMNVAISGSLKMLGRLIGENITLTFLPQPDLGQVFMDPTQLDQILANLSVNARDAIAGTGQITIRATNATLSEDDCRDRPDFVAPGDYAVLTFQDDGAGMSPEVQARIFEPFFTTKPLGQGTGLGLATVYGIVKQNHGAITLDSAPGKGTAFTMYLPRLADPGPAAEAAVVEAMPTGTETVLLVEDEEPVLNFARRVLTGRGYTVLAAATPTAALALGAQHPTPIHLLLTDVVMPEMNGRELARRMREPLPGIRVLFMSGYSTDVMKVHGPLPPEVRLLQKPFSVAVLAQAVRAALDDPKGKG